MEGDRLSESLCEKNIIQNQEKIHLNGTRMCYNT